MRRQIIVPLNGADTIEDILPYIEEIARPEMKIVFVICCWEARSVWLNDQITLMQTGISTLGAVRAAINRESQRLEQKAMEAKIRSAGERLRQKKIQIVVSFCDKRSWPRIFSELTASRQDSLVVMAAPGHQVFRKLAGWLRTGGGAPFPAPHRPLLLFHP